MDRCITISLSLDEIYEIKILIAGFPSEVLGMMIVHILDAPIQSVSILYSQKILKEEMIKQK